ncbi:aldo/keto reductase [Ornithinimicrobium sp. Arc0846-15]|nr:aldo/keto reductase [Ornithinimicrobium laminariae]
MKKTTLGPDGPSVSSFALGTMTFGVETDEDMAHHQLDVFVEAGGTFIDTADVYGDGESERIIGRWLKRRGCVDDLTMATKGRFAPREGSAGASRRNLVHSVDASLQRLDLEVIDLYSVHGWDQETPVTETLDTLTELARIGKIKHVGWSNVTGWQLQEILSTAEHGGFVRPVALQPQYNLLDRTIELEVLPCALEGRLSITPWSPLGGGWLTGKYRAQQRPTGATRLGEDPRRGVEAYDLRNTDQTWRIISELESVAGEIGRPMAHVALAWLASRPGVSSTLLGARTLKQLTNNLAAANLELDQTTQERLTHISNPGLPTYPYGMIEDFCEVSVWQELGLR